MPTLHETERALYSSLVERDDSAARDVIVVAGASPEARLDVYRNTFVGVLTKALRLAFPAVERLVGATFFDGAARVFIENEPPRNAYLNQYGGDFPAFLETFRPAASLGYLPGVARLEWAVNCAVHAPDAEAFDVSRLSALDPGDNDRVRFAPHPSVGFVRSDLPVDDIWRSVLARDDAAMASIDLDAGPVHLLIHRFGTAVDVLRLDEPEWHFMAALCAGQPLDEIIGSTPDVDAERSLAEHLAAGCFIACERIECDRDSQSIPKEATS